MKEKEIFYKSTLYGEFISRSLSIPDFDKILASFIGSSKFLYKYKEKIFIQTNQSLFGYSIKVHSLENAIIHSHPYDKKM